MRRLSELRKRRAGHRGAVWLATAAAAVIATGAADRTAATASAYDSIVLGDSVVRSMTGTADTVNITLEAGTSVQVYAAPLPQFGTATISLGFLNPTGGNQARTATGRTDPNATAFHSAITTTGTYRIIVNRSAPGSYILKTRPAAALLTASAVGGNDRAVRAGTPLSTGGTLRIGNPGPVSTTFDIVTPTAPWLTVTTSNGVAAPGNTDVPVTFSTAGLPHGMHETTVRVNPGDPWGGSPFLSFWIRSYHPDVVRLVETAANVGEVAVLNDAFGLVHIGTQLHRFDTSTGALTEVASGLPAAPSGLVFMVAEADGGVTAVAGTDVLRIHGDGTRATLFQGGTVLSGLTAGAGSTYYTRHGANVWRIEPGTQPYIVGSFRSTGRGLMYNAVDGYLYGPASVDGVQGMQRMHAVSGTVQDVGTFATTVLTPIMAASGRVYINENNIYGGTYVFSPQGEMLTRLIMPGLGWGVALGNGVLFTTGWYPTSERGLYRLPVDDVPMPRVQRSATWGDATLSGAVGAADALVCLSQVVGRAANLADTSSCDVFPDGEGTYTGRITAADALVLLSAAVGNDVSAFRVGQARS
jgi:hypothetical protein